MRFSIVTVCLDSAATIADTLKSVDSQTGVELEHLVIDGGSHDATLTIVESHSREWRRIYSGKDKGLYDAMNKGINLARGEIVGFINADDFYATNTVLAHVSEVFQDQSVDACYGDLCYVRRARPDQVVRYWRSSQFRPGIFRHGWCPPHPTLFVRRYLYIKLGGFDISYRIAADMELMARFMERHRINARYLPQLIVKMRTGGASNNSLSDIVLQNVEIWRALKLHGLRPAVLPFVAGKLFARSRQFLSRPA